MSSANLRLIRILMILALTGAAMACTPKTARRTEHEGPRDWSAAPALPEEAPADFETLPREKVAIASGQTGVSILSEVIEPLAKKLLNRKTLAKATAKSGVVVERLVDLNEALLKVLLENPRSVSDEAMLPTASLYLAAVFDGCDADMNLCPRAGVFRRDPKSSLVVYRLAKILDDQIESRLEAMTVAKVASPSTQCAFKDLECRKLVRRKYRLLAMALMLHKSSYNNAELVGSYLMHTNIYNMILQSRKALAKKVSESYLDRVHEHLSETMIAFYMPKDIRSKQFHGFIERFGPWTYSLKAQVGSRLSTRKMFEFATKCCLYAPNDPSRISQSVVDGIAAAQAAVDESGKSFVQMTRDILNDPSRASIFANFGLAAEAGRVAAMDPTILDEYFFIVDRFYRGHIDFGDAKKILENTRPQSRARILQTARWYAKFSLIHMLIQTNDDLAKISTASTVASENYFQDTLTRSNLISERWLAGQSRMGSLIKLLGSHFKASGRTNAEYENLEKFFNGVSRNIHYIAIYPNMMMLTYYLADKRGNMIARTRWGARIEVTPDSIITQFFNGTHAPWFKYAENLETLSPTMLLYSFYYVLATNSIETFGTFKGDLGEVPMSHRAFFEKVIAKYLGADKRAVDKMLETVSDFAQAAPAYKKITGICDFEMGRSANSPLVELNLLDLQYYTYVGNGSDGSATGTIANGVLGDVTKSFAIIPGYLGTIRDQIQPRIRYVRTMVEMLKVHLNDSDPKLVADIEAMLAEIENKIAHIYGLAYYFNERVQPCLTQLIDVERYRQYRLYDEERRYLREVHAHLTQINQAPADAREAVMERLNREHYEKYRFDRLSSDSYFYSQIDLYSRLAEMIEKDIFSRPGAKDESEYSATELAKLRRARRTRVKINPGLERNDIVTGISGETLNYTPDVEEFVRRGMGNLNLPGAPGLVSWWQWGQYAILPHQVGIRTGIDLFLAGKFRALDVTRADCLRYVDQPVAGECYVMRKIGFDSLIERQLALLNVVRLENRDVRNMNDFGATSKLWIIANSGHEGQARLLGFHSALSGNLLDSANLRPLPPFNFLFQSLVSQADLKYETQTDRVTPDLAARLVQNGFSLAQTVNNLDLFTFEPTVNMRELLQRTYSESVNSPFVHLQEAVARMRAYEKSGNSWRAVPYMIENGSLRSLDAPSLAGRRVYLEDQKVEDVRITTQKFANETQNFFGTREAVQGKGH